MLALVPILLLLHAVGMWWLDRWSMGIAFETYLAWQRVLANVAVSLLAMLLIAAITRKLIASVLLVSGVQAAMFIASEIKFRSIGMPVVLQDAYFITGLDLSVLSLLSKYLQASWGKALAVLLAIVALVLGFWLEPAWCRRRGVMRLTSLAAAVALVVSLYFAAWPWTMSWYDAAHIRPSPLDLNVGALRGGQVASMVHSHGVQRHRTYEVDTAALQEALGVARQSSLRSVAPTGAKPDVVIVLSESFMDPRILKGMDDMPDLIPNVRRLLDSGHGGMMLAPAFGGGTVRTEFEVLTGMPVSAFPDAYYPYVDMNPGFLPSVVSVLEDAGYASLAIHGNAGGFWNRINTYGAMGVDQFFVRRDLVNAGARVDGTWISDASMTEFLLDQLKIASKPTVAVAISIQNHGPYAGAGRVGDPQELTGIHLPESLGADAASEFRNYLYHLRGADAQFQRLVEGLQARGRPFVLLFFGDHLPALTGGVYEQLGFVDDGAPKQQRVPWVLATGGDAVMDMASIKPALWPWQLPSRVLALAGRSDPYFDFVRAVGNEVSPQGGISEPRDARLMRGIRAGANARLQDQFEDYVDGK